MASAHFTTCNCRGMLACLWARKVPPGTISSISILFQPIYRSTPCARVETALPGRAASSVPLRCRVVFRSAYRLAFDSVWSLKVHDYVVTGGVSACDGLKCVVTTLFSLYWGLELRGTVWAVSALGRSGRSSARL